MKNDTELRALYLHGFASGPRSKKAAFLKDRFARELGLELLVPDLNEGEGGFRGLTISRMLAAVARALEGAERSVLIGSSLGGYVAGLFAARHADRVAAEVLLAPAFELMSRWEQWIGAEGLEAWRRTGLFEVDHYDRGRRESVGWGFFEDAARYEPLPAVRVPTLVINGRSDAYVPLAASERLAASAPAGLVRLVPVDDGHELAASLDLVWRETRAFLHTPGLE